MVNFQMSRRLTASISGAVFFMVSLSLLNSPREQDGVSFNKRPWASDVAEFLTQKQEEQTSWTTAPKRKINILLQATKTNVNLCKTMLTMSILGYPRPHIVERGDDDASNGLVGGGSHYYKITRVLEYLNKNERRKQPGFEDDLVLMVDSYDIWFQLPVQTLIKRYETILQEENTRVAHRLGRAYTHEGISSKVVFGAGNRCAPNQLQTVACYAVPESPIPYSIRGGLTDTILGRTPWSSYRTRYLNSGYMIDVVRDMRPLLERAKIKLEECIDRTDADFDDTSGGSDHCYCGSDQSIFVEMFGEQEFHREIMRRHHRGLFDDFLDGFLPNRPGARPPRTHNQNIPISDHVDPEFPHQVISAEYKPNKPFEYGIALDYWSSLSHQTANAEFNFRFIRHDRPIAPQIGDVRWLDCLGRTDMPQDSVNFNPTLLPLIPGEK